jgi:hypothetical protein
MCWQCCTTPHRWCLGDAGFRRLSAWGIEAALLVFLVIDLVLLWRFWVSERAKEKAALDPDLSAAQ